MPSRDLEGLRRILREIVEGTPPIAEPTARTSAKGSLSESLRVANANPAATWPVLQAVLGPGLEDAPSYRLLVGTLEQLVTGRLLDPAPPLVLTVRSGQALRCGFFHARTDRDAFIEALLGRPVPTRSRHLPAMPEVGGQLAGDLQSAAEAAGLPVGLLAAFSRRASLGDADVRQLIEAVASGQADPAMAGAMNALAEHPVVWSELPVGLAAEKLARAAPGWRTLSGRTAPELAIVTRGPWGNLGFAYWLAGDPGGRDLRAPFAAHLRYLFDYRIAPWGRAKKERQRRETACLFMSDWLDPPPTIRLIADAVRAQDPDAYRAEPMSRTRNRMRAQRAALSRASATAKRP